MSWTTLYEVEGARLRVRDPEWPPRSVEEVAQSLLPELEEFLSRARRAEPEVLSRFELLPGLTVARVPLSPGQPAFRVTAPRDTSGSGSFTTTTNGWTDPENAAEDARLALAEYPAYVRSLARELLKAGVDLQDLADVAMAESVMEG